MPNKIKPVAGSQSNCVETSSSDQSSSESKSENATGKFNEGRPSEKSSAALPATDNRALTPICPMPARIAIGTFSILAAVGGCVMSVLGSNGLYDHTAADHSLHRGLLGGGLTMIAAGGMGIMATFLIQKQVQAPAPA